MAPPPSVPLTSRSRTALDAADRPRVCVVIGTRPEAIKLAPIVAALRVRAHEVEVVVVATSQHREMLRQALHAFAIVPDIDLDLMLEAQDHREFTARAMPALRDCFRRLAPAAVLVQGDTSTVAAAAFVGRSCDVVVGHVEAGLRSGDITDPFPEELNRRIATLMADLHFAPTERARVNLIAEGVDAGDVFVTGNTAVDAASATACDDATLDAMVPGVRWDAHRVLLVTVHRRENHGERLRAICAAIRHVLARHVTAEVVLPVHRNPAVQRIILDELTGVERAHLTDPLPYPALLAALRRSHFVLSDSGGLQEEIASFGKPILILRDTTERPEAIESGFGRLVGASAAAIEREVARLLDDPAAYAAMCGHANPFGDGFAAHRIVDTLLRRLARPSDIPSFVVRRTTPVEVRRLRAAGM